MDEPWSDIGENPLRLFILGGTGKTGQALLEFAVQRGHHVTTLVRSPEKLEDFRGAVTVKRGDPTKAGDLRVTIPGHDAVISALGHRSLLASNILVESARNTVRVMEEYGVRRLLVVSVGLLFDEIGFWGSILRDTLLHNVVRDSIDMEHVIQSGRVDWTIARPPLLTSGQPSGAYVAADGQLPQGGHPWVSRADLATFLLDEVERPAHINKIVGVASAKVSAGSLAPQPPQSSPGYWF